MNCRKGEELQTRFRTDRFHCINGKWYLTLRENETIGPFESKEEAQIELLFVLRENGFITSTECFESIMEEALDSGFQFGAVV